MFMVAFTVRLRLSKKYMMFLTKKGRGEFCNYKLLGYFKQNIIRLNNFSFLSRL